MAPFRLHHGFTESRKTIRPHPNPWIFVDSQMRLAPFILSNIEPILKEWENFARALLPGATMTVLALRDDAESILRATAQDMQNPQTAEEQARKSKGGGGAATPASARLDDASELHGVDRMGAGFHINDVIAEYRALRASVLRLWRESRPQPTPHAVEDITRFDECLDQSLARSVGTYSERVDASRKMFLAILSHDLRNPMSSIGMTAQSVAMRNPDAATASAMALINRNIDTMSRLVSDLIDFSSTGLGRTLPIHRGMVDLAALCHDVIESCVAAHPGHDVRLHVDGDVNGVWDAGRIRQVISNLVGNAIQHGAPGTPVDLTVTTEGSDRDAGKGRSDTVVLSVHNEGEPIPASLLPNIFDPLKRYATRESIVQRKSGSIGLGLYIVREIVTTKGGSVDVESRAGHGTTFTVRIPRFLPVQDNPEPAAQPLQ